MSLVERFIEIQQWPRNRKVALVAAYVAMLTGFNFTVGRIFVAPTGWVDMTFFDTMGVLFVGHGALVAVVAWRMDPSRGETLALLALAVPYSALLLVFLWGFGFLSTAFIVIAPLSAVVTMVVFEERVGRAAAVALIVATAVVLGVTATGWFDYAPAIQDRSLDAQGSTRLVLTVGFGVFTAMSANVWFAWVVVSAGRLTSVRLAQAHRLIARYVPAEVAQDILEGRSGGDEGHERRKITVFFSDLVGFSDIAEELEPEDLAMVLNEYFGGMTEIAHRHHGTVDELQGDALLILFGAPHATTDKEHALNAVRMASEMHEAMASLNARWRKAGITETLAVRMGINTGVVTVGNFGTPTRMKYAALGKHVNVAARLQAIAEPGTTVISYATYLLVEDEAECRALGPQQLKGITKPVEAYAVS